MKILYVSGLYADGIFEQLRKDSKIPLQNAPDVFQKAILRGLRENKADFEVVTYPFVPSYPFRYKRLTVPSASIRCEEQVVGLSGSFNTFFLFKKRSVQRELYRYVQNWIERQQITKDERFAILTYTPSSSFLTPLSKIKKQYPNVIITTIVTDLIDNVADFASNRSLIKRVQLYAEKRNILKSYNIIDKYILLTEAMVEKIPQAANSHIIIEGIYGGEPTKANVCRVSPKKIVYSGALLSFAGVLELIEAFKIIQDKEAELYILGSGECEDTVKKEAGLNNRIHFLGPQPREIALKHQKEATILVNPRRPNGSITRYSFPSKTMEYLASGTPMIGYSLEGIPEDYHRFLNTPNDLSTESLAEKIDELLQLDVKDICQKGEEAQRFIYKNKLAVHQVRKILDFIENR